MATTRLIEIPVVFYRSAGGAEPVLDWLRHLPPDDRRAIGTDLATIQFGWPIGMPALPPIGSRLVGSPQHAAEPSYRPLAVFCPPGADRRGAWLYQENAENTARRFGYGTSADERDAGMSSKNPHWGTSLDSFLTEDGIREAVKVEAITRVIAWQLSQEMERQGITKAKLAELMQTSRAQVDRILQAKGNVTIESLQRAAVLLGRELRLELV
jgi:antitoxin HicB